MPLKNDGLDRGECATHVHRHPKLGRHRTVTNAALPLANMLIDQQRIRRVDLGQIWYPGPHTFKPHLGLEVKGSRIGITFAAQDSMQVLHADASSRPAALKISREIRKAFGSPNASG